MTVLSRAQRASLAPRGWIVSGVALRLGVAGLVSGLVWLGYFWATA